MTHTPAFERSAMTRTQETAWLSAFVVALQHTQPPNPDDHFLIGERSSAEDLREWAAKKADFIVSLLPVETLPCHADKEDRDSSAGISRCPLSGHGEEV